MPRKTDDSGRRAGSTADLSEEEAALMFAAKTPPEHDYAYDDDPEPAPKKG
jgi:hypothetical protein